MDVMTWLRAEWDRVLGFSLIALGAVLLVIGYLGVSHSTYVAEQLSYIASGGLGGLFLLGAGATLLILADLHDEWRKLDRVEAILSGQLPVPTAATPPVHINGSSPAPVPAPVAGALAVASGPRATAVVRQERFSLGIGMLLGVAVLFGSWARTSSVDEPKQAIAALAVAILGLLLLAFGAVGSTLTVKRHVQLRKASVFSGWMEPQETAAAAPVLGTALVISAGLTRYHLAGCPSVVGLPTLEVERRNLPSGLVACQLCGPEEVHLPPPAT